jgi:integrase
MVAAEGDQIERMFDSGLPEKKGQQAAPQGISEFKKAIGTFAGDVGDHAAATVKPLEYLLIDAVVLVGTRSVDHRQLEAEFVLHDGADNDVEEFLHGRVFRVRRIEQPHAECGRLSERLQKAYHRGDALCGVAAAGVEPIDPTVWVQTALGPEKGHFEYLPRQVAPKSEPHPAMPSVEVPMLMRELLADGSTEARALAFTILTAARTSETIDAKWKEIDVGPAGAVWTVPKERMKGKPEDRTEHRVPICPAALKLLGKRGAAEDYIFPSRRYGARKPLWHASMLVMLKSLRGSVYVVHGFRATFSGDWAAKAGYSLELRERALHHVVGDSSLVAYNRDELVEQRRPMMAAWAKFAIGTR